MPDRLVRLCWLSLSDTPCLPNTAAATGPGCSVRAMSRPYAVSFFVAKGGVGKSTSATLVSAEAASRGLRVLLVDLDCQRNASLLVDPVVPETGDVFTILDVAAHGAPGGAVQGAVPTEWTSLPPIAGTTGALDVIIGDPQFKDSEVAKYGFECLALALDGAGEEYDLVVFDCPPSTGLVVQAALAASDGVVLVSEAQHLSVVGLAESAEFVDEFNSTAGSLGALPVRRLGVVVTKFKHQLEQVAAFQEIRELFPDEVFGPVVPERAVVQRAMAAHVPVAAYPGSAAREVASAYQSITDSVLAGRASLVGERV